MATTTYGATMTSNVSPDSLPSGFTSPKSAIRKAAAPRKRKRASDKFIAGAIKHPGSLHKALGVPLGQKIPAAKLNEAVKSTSPDVRNKARFAKTLAGFSSKK